VQSIIKVFQKVFSEGEIVLFGSRIDDNQKGGDIDLFIKPSVVSDSLFEQKLRFLTALKKEIGDQKIDLVLEPYAPDALKQEVYRTGVILCRP
jgi:predicted nucleotidyltransferase